MKFKKIYDALQEAGVSYSDHSTWREAKPSYIGRLRPLWIIAENRTGTKRIWIVKEYGKLRISIAQIIDGKNKNKYVISCRNQAEMAEQLREIL